jgi:uncharacterized protein Yka (UPF0111/DUF47 family)
VSKPHNWFYMSIDERREWQKQETAREDAEYEREQSERRAEQAERNAENARRASQSARFEYEETAESYREEIGSLREERDDVRNELRQERAVSAELLAALKEAVERLKCHGETQTRILAIEAVIANAEGK